MVLSTLTESAFNLVGILADLNRLYFTTFQFKKTHRFLDQMQLKPENFDACLLDLFHLDSPAAAVSLEALVSEVVALVEREMSGADVSAVKKRLGQHRPAWQNTQ